MRHEMCMRRGAFFNISFEPQLDNSPNLVLIDISKHNNFEESYEQFWWTRAKFQVLFNLATCSNHSITNCVKIPVFPFFEKVNKGQLKMVNVNY